MENAVTSVAVPEVEEIAQKRALRRSFGRPKTLHMIDFIAAESDIEAALRSPFVSVISDSTYPTTGLLHPRVYGTYARLLERYVRERRVLTLEQAVERVTSRPAALFGLRDRGVLAAGRSADLCVFDPARVHEAGTYADPARFAEGMAASPGFSRRTKSSNSYRNRRNAGCER